MSGDDVATVREALEQATICSGPWGAGEPPALCPRCQDLAREALAALDRLAQERDEWERRHAQRWEEVQQACERAEMAFRERDEARENNAWAGDVIKTADEALARHEARAVAAEEALARIGETVVLEHGRGNIDFHVANKLGALVEAALSRPPTVQEKA